ncbi:hypothetical protein [Bradyrhizobium sp. 1(2017)]|uniref:hypothetical protein n=1 Tax=Bradyrhizobium sp. 1(2017) TaxID=1404888 RepID=UPI00140F2E06|nr:hypothetical protein [Bradyrhizobium sp. 1(2017)]QIO35881.1 hypothetical protein HAP40_30740 [Bradyrhizobium sp. 1(2017)]
MSEKQNSAQSALFCFVLVVELRFFFSSCGNPVIHRVLFAGGGMVEPIAFDVADLMPWLYSKTFADRRSGVGKDWLWKLTHAAAK